MMPMNPHLGRVRWRVAGGRVVKAIKLDESGGWGKGSFFNIINIFNMMLPLAGPWFDAAPGGTLWGGPSRTSEWGKTGREAGCMARAPPIFPASRSHEILSAGMEKCQCSGEPFFKLFRWCWLSWFDAGLRQTWQVKSRSGVLPVRTLELVGTSGKPRFDHLLLSMWTGVWYTGKRS
jgi:hypothetical protein